MSLSARIRRIRESATIGIVDKAKRLEKLGRKIVYLNAGEPDFDTPEHIRDAARDAMYSGFVHYTPSRGIPELRERIAEKLNEENNLDVKPDDVIVTPGSKQAIYEAILALVDEGDEVLIPAPAWVSYEEMVKIAGGIPKYVRSNEEFKINPEELERNITRRTKMLIMNTPNNPSGVVYSEREIREIAEIVASRKIFVLSDEVYEKIIYEGRHFSIGSIPEVSDLTITVNGFSKAYAMTGWRIGYAAGPSKVISAMNKIQQHTVTCAPSFVQKAAIAALTSPQDCVKEMVDEFKKRRDFIFNELAKVNVFRVNKPQGAFYLFPDVSSSGMDSEAFTDFMLTNLGIVVVPGRSFGGYNSHIRISYANSMDVLREAVNRIRSAFT